MRMQAEIKLLSIYCKFHKDGALKMRQPGSNLCLQLRRRAEKSFQAASVICKNRRQGDFKKEKNYTR